MPVHGTRYLSTESDFQVWTTTAATLRCTRATTQRWARMGWEGLGWAGLGWAWLGARMGWGMGMGWVLPVRCSRRRASHGQQSLLRPRYDQHSTAGRAHIPARHGRYAAHWLCQTRRGPHQHRAPPSSEHQQAEHAAPPTPINNQTSGSPL